MIKITWNFIPKQSNEKFKMLIRITNAAEIQKMMHVRDLGHRIGEHCDNFNSYM